MTTTVSTSTPSTATASGALSTTSSSTSGATVSTSASAGGSTTVTHTTPTLTSALRCAVSQSGEELPAMTEDEKDEGYNQQEYPETIDATLSSDDDGGYMYRCRCLIHVPFHIDYSA